VPGHAPQQDADLPRVATRGVMPSDDEWGVMDDRALAEEPPPRPRTRAAAPNHRSGGRSTDNPSASPALARHDTQQVVAAAVVATAAVVAFDVALTARLSMFFDLCFVLVGLWAALVVRRPGLYAVGVLPPLLLGAVVAFLAVTMPATLTASHLAFVSTWLTGLAQHGVALGATHVVVLAIVGLRAGEARGGRSH
jgi:hypothetical protein